MRNNGDSKIFLNDQNLDFLPKFFIQLYIYIFCYSVNLSHVRIMKYVNIAFGSHYM
jgi:hypothetical protein